MKDIAIFGVGGFGREVLALIQDINRVEPQWNIVGFFDDGYEKQRIKVRDAIHGSRDIYIFDKISEMGL